MPAFIGLCYLRNHHGHTIEDIILNCDCFTRAYNCLRFHLYPGVARPDQIPLGAVLAIDRPRAIKNLGLKTYAAICKAFEESGIDYRDTPWWLTAPVSWRDRVSGQEGAKWPN